ncbi:MAG: DUF397 domain-containing protein [Nocardiopsaceae bacterium]|nr:DUF397 domain-containing protein [Nocardiopsaceae bacterium]
MTNARPGRRRGDLGRAQWRKSHYSSPQGNCVEIAALPGGRVAVRDSRHPSGPALIFGRTAWLRFIRTVKAHATPVSLNAGTRAQ